MVAGDGYLSLTDNDNAGAKGRIRVMTFDGTTTTDAGIGQDAAGNVLKLEGD